MKVLVNYISLLATTIFVRCCLSSLLDETNHQSSNGSRKILCRRWNNQSNENEVDDDEYQEWYLVWHDEFDAGSAENFEENWNVMHETYPCNGNHLEQVNCNTNRTENVAIVDGHLVLTARQEEYNGFNEFTAATLTTRSYFTHGRYEIRMANPLGSYLRTSVFTRNDKESYWHENGQIDLFSYTQLPVVHRGVHFADSRDFYESADLKLINATKMAGNPWMDSMHDFHLFGVEWNNDRIRFFMDQTYGPSIKFISGKKYLKSYHQIRIQLGVGGVFFAEKNFSTKIQWKCPALVMDYIRIYERRSPTNSNSSSSIIIDQSAIPECDFDPIDPEKDRRTLAKICSVRRHQSLTRPTTQASDLPISPIDMVGTTQMSSYQFVIILILILIVLFVIVSTYLIIQIKRFGTRVMQTDQIYGVPAINLTASNNGTDNDEGIYHSIALTGAYEDPMYHYVEFEGDLGVHEKMNRKSGHSFQPVKSVQNEYLEITPAPAAAIQQPLPGSINSEYIVFPQL